MSDFEFSDKKILLSWRHNASPWINAIDSGGIASRQLVTNAAIVAAAVKLAPRTVLDVGCGEGWLARELAGRGIEVYGVDGVRELVEAASRRAGPREQYVHLSYQELAAGRLRQRFDALVCNFSLIGKESVDGLFMAAGSLLNPGGHLIVQTLHPLVACGGADYRDGWRPGSWAGFGAGFCDPAPWYFRTLSSWLELFRASGLQLQQLEEPLHPQTGKPASLILAGALPA